MVLLNTILFFVVVVPIVITLVIAVMAFGVRSVDIIGLCRKIRSAEEQRWRDEWRS